MKEHLERLKVIIDSCENLLHGESAIRMIDTFHQRYKHRGHDEAMMLYGYLEGVLKHKQRITL